MKKQLTHIAVLKTGIFLGTLYGVISLVFVIPLVLMMGFFGAAIPHSSANVSVHGVTPVLFPSMVGTALSGGIALFFSIMIPIFYAIIGFISGVIVATVYNFIAKFTGGLEFEVRDLPPSIP